MFNLALVPGVRIAMTTSSRRGEATIDSWLGLLQPFRRHLKTIVRAICDVLLQEALWAIGAAGLSRQQQCTLLEPV